MRIFKRKKIGQKEMNFLPLELQDLIISTIEFNNKKKINNNKTKLFYLKFNFINNYYVSEFIINRYYLNNLIKYNYDFLDNRIEWKVRFLDYCCYKGRFKLVKFLHFHTKERCTEYAMDQSSENGHYQIMKFLHYNRTEGCRTFAIERASMNGHFKIVKFLCENRTEGFTDIALSRAKTPEIETYLLNHLHLEKKDE